jgi:hypothetical protein
MRREDVKMAADVPEVISPQPTPQAQQQTAAQTLQQEQLILHIQQLRRQQLVEQGTSYFIQPNCFRET